MLRRTFLRSDVVYVPSSAQFLDDLCHELATKEWWYRLQKEGAHVKCAKLISKFTGEKVTEIVSQDSECHLRKLVRVGSEDRPVYVRLSDQGLGVSGWPCSSCGSRRTQHGLSSHPGSQAQCVLKAHRRA